jgi:hypothetical protein
MRRKSSGATALYLASAKGHTDAVNASWNSVLTLILKEDALIIHCTQRASTPLGLRIEYFELEPRKKGP